MLRKVKNFARRSAGRINGMLAVLAQERGIGQRADMSVSDVFFMQLDQQELLRYDIVIRYLAIENYYGKNDDGFMLYRKMQDKRIREGYGNESEERFRKLIASYEGGGYRKDSCIVVDKNLSLIDGSHRIALHLYLGLGTISVLILPTKKPSPDYSIDWFFQKGFTNAEIDRILEKGKELTEKSNIGLSCVIWSPAAGLSDDIIRDLRCFGRVDHVRRSAYSPVEYQNMVKAIYAIDDIADWKVQAKLEHMRQEEPELISMRFYPVCPDFRIKDVSGMPLSRRGERVKRCLRARYRDQIEDYYVDVIMHSADNFAQSAYMFRVLDPDIDMAAVLEMLGHYTYALTKTDSPYYPVDFPQHIPVGKDVDILCLPQDCQNIVRELKSVLARSTEYAMRIIEGEHGTRIRLEEQKHLIFQFDVSFAADGLADGFFEEALAYRESYGDYMRLSAPYEYVNRAASYRRDNTKTQHLEYLTVHRADLDETILSRYVGMTAHDLDALIEGN